MRSRKKASFTADAACAARAYAAKLRDPLLRGPDHLAPRIVGFPFRALLWPIIRRRFVKEYERRAPGIFFYHQARTKVFDAILDQEIRAGIGQLVILGAGFDTRAYRFAIRMPRVKVFEVDHPLTSAEKRRRLRRLFGELPGRVTYVAVDFEREDPGVRLAESGMDAAARTLFLWEGVTPYLSRASVESTLALVARAGGGSSVVFDYLHARALTDPSPEATKHRETAARAGEPYDFAIEPGDVAAFVAKLGLELVSSQGPDELQRLLIGRAGRPWGRLPRFLGIAHARTPSGARA